MLNSIQVEEKYKKSIKYFGFVCRKKSYVGLERFRNYIIYLDTMAAKPLEYRSRIYFILASLNAILTSQS